MEILIILLLIIINGVFAMAEIAMVSARKSKLKQQSTEGDKNAQIALDLASAPNRFLSTVQIGITFIGIFAGAFGGETIAKSLSMELKKITLLAPYSDGLSLFIVVTTITYLSLVLGELVPKRLALSNPERIAKFVAGPMIKIASITSPLVNILSLSTDWVVKILGIKSSDESSVNEEEVHMLIQEGARIGIFNLAEKDIVERTLKMGDKKVNTVMTPRKEIIWLEADSTFKELRHQLVQEPHSHYPVCREGLDTILGVIRTEDLLKDFLTEEKIDLNKSLRKPVFVPETIEILKVLEMFKKTGIHIALIVDEYGSILGLLSLTDILEEIVGDIPDMNELDEQQMIKREDGSILVDGLVSIDTFKEYFHLRKLPDEKSGLFHTVGGFFMHKLERIPIPGDTLTIGNLQFEVMDMDENRIDKILIKTIDQ